MLDRAAAEAVARPKAAVFVDHHFGHQKQRDTAGTGRRIGQFGQYKVDDVLGEIVLTTGNEDLGAADLVRSVRVRLGLGANDAQIGTCVWLGQAHGAGPDTGIHVRQVLLLQLFAGMGVDGQAGAGGQHRVQTERQAGRVHHLLDLRRDCLRHAHAAVGWVTAYTDPTAFGIKAIGLRVSRRGGYRAVDPAAAFLITTAVERRNRIGGDLARLLEDGFGGFRIDDFR